MAHTLGCRSERPAARDRGGVEASFGAMGPPWLGWVRPGRPKVANCACHPSGRRCVAQLCGDWHQAQSKGASWQAPSEKEHPAVTEVAFGGARAFAPYIGTVRASFATSQHPNTIISYRRTPPLLHCSLPQFLSPPQDDPDQAEHVLGNSTSGQKEDRLGAAPDHAQRAANRQRAAITVQTHYRLNMKRQLVMSRMVPLLRRDSTSERLRGRRPSFNTFTRSQSFVDTSTKSRGRLLDTPPARRSPERPRRASCEF